MAQEPIKTENRTGADRRKTEAEEGEGEVKKRLPARKAGASAFVILLSFLTLIIVSFIVAAGEFIWTSHYADRFTVIIPPGGSAIYKLDKLTGDLSFCNDEGCRVLAPR